MVLKSLLLLHFLYHDFGSARKLFYTNQMGFSSSLICRRIARIGYDSKIYFIYTEVLRQFFHLILIRPSFVCFLHLFGLLNLDNFSAKIYFSFEDCNPFPLCLKFVMKLFVFLHTRNHYQLDTASKFQFYNPF